MGRLRTSQPLGKYVEKLHDKPYYVLHGKPIKEAFYSVTIGKQIELKNYSTYLPRFMA